MQERRRNKRYLVELMEINSKMMLANEVKILDISIGGVSLKVDRRLNMGNEYALSIENKGKLLSVKGMVVWSMISDSRVGPQGDIIPIYTAGMQFNNVPEEKIKEIVEFIEEQKKEEEKHVNVFEISGLRLYARVHIDDPEKAVLNCLENCKVKKLSLSGMLIESKQPLEPESRLKMELALSEDKHINFIGRITSSHSWKNEDLEYFDIGLEFLEMSDDNKQRLEEFINLLSYIDEG